MGNTPRPVFDVYLVPHKARVWLNGLELTHVRDVKVHQPLEGPAIVTVEFYADVRGNVVPVHTEGT